MYSREDFINALFDDNEGTGYGDTNNQVCHYKTKQQFLDDTTCELFSVNPFNQWKVTDNMKNVSLLFEVDKKIGTKEQIRLFLKSGMPFTTMTYSGGKSIHCIIRFNRSFKDSQWSYAWWYAIDKVLKQYGIESDDKARLVTQISRVPDVIRNDSNKKQTLIYVRDRVDQEEMYQWIQKHGVDIEVPKPRVTKPYIPDSNSTISDKEKWKAAYNMYKSKHGDYNPSLDSGNWMNLIYFATYCYKVDLDLNPCISLSQSKFGTTFMSTRGGGNIDEALAEGYDWSESNRLEKIKLNTKDEYKAILQKNAVVSGQKLTNKFMNYGK